jgi:hypothetical protein
MDSICGSRPASGLDEAMCNGSDASFAQARSFAATCDSSFGAAAHPASQAAESQAVASKSGLNGARMFCF